MFRIMMKFRAIISKNNKIIKIKDNKIIVQIFKKKI